MQPREWRRQRHGSHRVFVYAAQVASRCVRPTLRAELRTCTERRAGLGSDRQLALTHLRSSAFAPSRQDALENLQLDGLHEMSVKTRVLRSRPVLALAVSTQRDQM